MEIQRTAINAVKEWESIEIVISDNPDETKAKEYIAVKVAVQAEENRPLAEAQIKALRRARDVIDGEIRRIADLQGRMPS